MTTTPSFHPDNAELPQQAVARDRNAFRYASRRDSSHQSARTAAPPEAARPRVARPRGRLLIALLLLAACGSGVATIWESLIRYRAFGVVVGQIIEVSAPTDGLLESVRVLEGDMVRQDTVLASLRNLEVEHKLQRVEDELKVVEAQLQAEVARVQWQTHVDETEMTRSIAEFHETTSRHREGSGELSVLRDKLQRTRDLHQKRSATNSELTTQIIQEQACEEKVAAIEEALVILKERAEKAAAATPPGEEQIEPLIAQSRLLLNEMKRLRQWLDQGNLSAPVSGTVLRRLHPAGEVVRAHEPLFSLIEDSSLEIELYLPQSQTMNYQVGDILELKVEPNDDLIPCEVVSIGAEHRKPPQQLEVFYRAGERLLPIRLRPGAVEARQMRLPVGAVAKLPWRPLRG